MPISPPYSERFALLSLSLSLHCLSGSFLLTSIVQNTTHLAISAMLWVEKVRGGSMHLNHPELVHKNPALLWSPVKM